jgi:endonuclease/exonuclease/phosphatase family metal-dependent hydrolase
MIQEIRACKNEVGDDTLEPLDIAYGYAKRLRMSIAGFEPINSTELSFWRLTLYNKKKLWCQKSVPVRTYDATNVDYTFDKDFGRMLLLNKFAPLNGEKTILGTKAFWTCNVHYPLQLNDKLAYTRLLKDAINDLCSDQQVVVMGDCNVFMDNGGKEQLQYIKECKLEDHTTKLDTTFVSFPWDKMQATSHLDYVFTRCDKKYPVNVSSVTTVDLTKRQLSDHFPIIILIDIE